MTVIINQEKISALATEVGEENIPVLLDIFLNELSSYIDMLSDQGVQIQIRTEQLKEICHALKSSAASFGADRLCALAIELDSRGKSGLLTAGEQDIQDLVHLIDITYTSYSTMMERSS
jgi:two-component system phosphorelay protein LuxU